MGSSLRSRGTMMVLMRPPAPAAEGAGAYAFWGAGAAGSTFSHLAAAEELRMFSGEGLLRGSSDSSWWQKLMSSGLYLPGVTGMKRPEQIFILSSCMERPSIGVLNVSISYSTQPRDHRSLL